METTKIGYTGVIHMQFSFNSPLSVPFVLPFLPRNSWVSTFSLQTSLVLYWGYMGIMEKKLETSGIL